MSTLDFPKLLYEDLQKLFAPLTKAIRSPTAIHGFFENIGWNMSGMVGADIETILEKFQVIQDTLKDIKTEETLSQTEINELGSLLENEFEILCREILNTSFPNIGDEHISEFIKDCGQFLLFLFFAKEYPLIFQIGELLGLITYDNREAIVVEEGENEIILRYESEAYSFHSEAFWSLPSRILTDFLAALEMVEGISLENFIQAVKIKIDQHLKEVKSAHQDNLAHGILVILNAEGLSINGKLFGFSQLSTPVTIPLPPEDKLTLKLNGNECKLLWGTLLDHMGQSVPMISAGGLSLQLGDSEVASANAELRFYVSEEQSYFELKGQTAFQLPEGLINDAETSLKSSGLFKFRYELDGDYFFQLSDLLITGKANIGGADGFQLSDCSVSVQDIQYPFPTGELDLRFQAEGTLSWRANGLDSAVQVEVAYTKESMRIIGEADLYLGNGIWLHPMEGLPLLQSEFQSNGSYDFVVNALFKLPNQNGGTEDISIQGNLTLVQSNGQMKLTQFIAQSNVQNLDWELPGGIKIRKTSLGLTYNNQNFKAVIQGELDLKNNQFVEMTAELLFPDHDDPSNIQLNTTIQVTQLNFFDQLYLFTGQLKLDVTTKPLFGKMEILDGSGGFIALKDTGIQAQASDFHFSVSQLNTILEFNTNGFEIKLLSGKLQLPDNFNQTGDQRAKIGIGNPPISLIYENHHLAFEASLFLENIGLNISPEGEMGFTALLEKANLSLSNTEPVPKINDAKGQVTIPVSGMDPIVIAFDEADWDITGYPIGSIYLSKDISFPLGGGFILQLPGGVENGIQNGLSVNRQENGLPEFLLNGAVDLVIPVDMLTMENGDQIIIGSSGNIRWKLTELPKPDLEELRFGGSFLLGGANGIRIQEGELVASGIANMFEPSEAHPFKLKLSGKIFLGENGPGAGIQDASFTFMGNGLPKFDFQGFYVKPGEELLGAIEQLPLKVRDLEVNFIESFPLPQKLDATNIRVTLSAELELPMPSGGSLLGMVDDIAVHFNQQGIPIRKDGNPGIDIGGIGMGIDGFEAGGVMLTGVVYLGGLDQPENLFFAGKLGGKFNGTGVSALLALGTKGPYGLCLEVSGGSAGIPLAYGFMLTGAEGGVVFPNLDGRVSNADPCDIRTYIKLNDEGKPERTDQAPNPKQAIPEEEKVIGHTVAETVIPEFDCPMGPCPSPAISIISQPHPDRREYPDRVILKFTSIDEGMLQLLGITPAFFSQLGLTTPDAIAEATVGKLFDLVEQGFPDLNALPIPPEAKNEVIVLSEKLKEDTRNLLVREFATGIGLALNGNSSVYEAVREMAYAGIPSPETTLKLTGSFSYAGVSVFLSITGGFSISTVMIPQPVPLISTVGILGSINLLGIPMGTARLFMNLTDASGTPLLLPTICGEVYAGIGPVEFGQMRMKFEAEGLTDGLANAGVVFAQHLSGPLIMELVNLFAKEVLNHPDYDPAQPSSVFGLMNLDQLVSFAGALVNLPPDRISPDIQDCLLSLMNNAWESFDPKFTLCGQIQPKIFGFGLGSELATAKINITKTKFAAQFGISPSYLISYFFGGIFPAMDKGSVGMAFELPDPMALLNKILSSGPKSLNQITAYSMDGMEHVLENAVYTVEYELVPFGLKMADAEARLIMPDLLDHPARPNSSWKRPEDRSGKNYLPRLQLLLTTLDANVLANPLWKGTPEELESLTANATFGLGMKDYFPHGGLLGAAKLSLPLVLLDGIPPALMNEVFLLGSDLFSRFNAAKNIFENYIFKTEDIGQLAFYVPFPNPPSFTIDGQDPTPLQIVKKMQSDGLDWKDFEAGPLLSLEQAFFNGKIQNARVLGIPVFEASVIAYGPDPNTQTPGRLEIQAEVPQSTWLNEFVEQVALNFTLTQAPPRPVDEYFRDILDLMQYYQENPGRLANNSATVELYSDPEFQGIRQSLKVGDYLSRDLQIGNDRLSSIFIPADAGLKVVLYEDDNFKGRNIVLTGSLGGLGNFDELVSSIRVVSANPLDNLQDLMMEGLPKMVLEARVDRLRIPDALSAHFKVQAETSLLIKAYSPFYNPHATGNGLDAQMQRNGGIFFGFQGHFGVKGIFEVDIPNIQLAMLPFSDTSVFPKVLGEFTANRIDIPLGLPFIEQARVYFNSAPIRGENLVEIQGQMSHLPLGFFKFMPITGNRLTISLIVNKTNNSGNFNLSLSPVKIGEDGFIRSDLTLHGNSPDQPFTISSDRSWTAAATGKRIALFTRAIEVLRINSGSPVRASVAGKGFAELELQVEIPLNIQITAFPGLAVLKRNLQITNQGKATLFLNSNGTFSMVATTSPFIFGIIRISGLNNGNMGIRLSQNGFELPTGAQLHLLGLTQTPYSLEEMVINTDTTFVVKATGGKIGIGQFFEISGGKLAVNRTNMSSSISVVGPTFSLFPGTPFNNKLTTGNFSIDSNGNFSIDSVNQRMNISGLLDAKGRFVFTKTGSSINGKIENATLKLVPLDFALNGSLVIHSQQIVASLTAKSFQLPGLIDISSASWQLDWRMENSFSLKANNPSLKVLNVALVPKGQFVFQAKSNGSYNLAFSTNSNFVIISGLLELGPATSKFSKSATSVYNLTMHAKINALKNPVNGQWILSQTADINLSNGNFKKEITALRNKTFVNIGLGSIYTNNLSRVYFGRNNNAYYFEFDKLRFKVMGMENNVSGSCNANGSLSLQWDTARELQLGPFRLPNRKAEVSLNLKNAAFNLKIPAGNLTAPNVPGFPNGGIPIPHINIGTGGDFVINLNPFDLNGIKLSTIGSQNSIKLYGKEKMIRIRNRKTLWGASAAVNLDIKANGTVSGSVSGSFKLNSITVGLVKFDAINLGSATLIYSSTRKDYQFQATLTLNNVLGKKKTTSTKTNNVWDFFAGIWKTVTETVTTWVSHTFKIRVILQYGSKGAKAEVKIL